MTKLLGVLLLIASLYIIFSLRELLIVHNTEVMRMVVVFGIMLAGIVMGTGVAFIKGDFTNE